jgi:hypothetical protein
MQIWNQNNVEIPEVILTRVKSRSDFHQYYRFSVTKVVTEKPSRYAGRQCGTGVLLEEFSQGNGFYQFHGYRMRPAW